jgi:hypothetical protein
VIVVGTRSTTFLTEYAPPYLCRQVAADEAIEDVLAGLLLPPPTVLVTSEVTGDGWGLAVACFARPGRQPGQTEALLVHRVTP